MKKTIAIFFLITYLPTYSEFGQLLKRPQLVQHFKEHQLLDPAISAYQFLEIHYSGIFNVDDDFQKDQQLPFRTSACMSHSIVVCEAPSLFGAYDIFQPPRDNFS